MAEIGGGADLRPLYGLIETIQAAMPTAATVAPPAVADSSAKGTDALEYALGNHTHASKVRKIRAQCAADGTLAWTYSTPFDPGVNPIVLAVAETAAGVTDVFNVQLVGAPTAMGCNLLVNRTQRSAVALLGLTILSLPSTVGVTWVHAVALAP